MRPPLDLTRATLPMTTIRPMASSSSHARPPLRLARPLTPCTCSRREIHSSRSSWARVKGHYEALSLPRNATKQQVKARFYELSKKHHPDAPGGSSEKFHEINDAYHTLGDEGRRRQYDNTTTQASRGGLGSSSSSFYPHSPGSRPSAQGPHRSWNRRPPRSPNEPFNPFARPHAYPRTDPFAQASGTGTPFGGGGRTSTGRRRPEGSSEEFEGLRAEGGLWRFGVVVGLLVAVVSFGGGLSVSAEELYLAESFPAKEGHDERDDEGEEDGSPETLHGIPFLSDD